MDIEPTLIEVEAYYYDPSKERFFVKVTFLGTGMFINSFSVQPSKFEGQPLWVQPPKHRQRGGFVPTVDFDKSYPLWRIIELKAIEAAQNYHTNNSSSGGKDTVVEDIPEGPITLDDIPF